MTIEGRIAIDVGFTDLHTASSVQNAQRITFTSTDSYSSGKVAVVSGTLGTAAVSVALQPTTFRDASGSLVSFNNVSRVVGQTSRPCQFDDIFGSSVKAQTLCLFGGGDELTITPGYTAGTATYTVFLYGS